jgi:TRAP-type C4-dicarboxylate transport system substrate-binding protein
VSRAARRRRGLLAAAAITALGLAAASAAATPPPPPPEPVRLGFGTIAPEGTPWADQMVEIKQRIERESGGRVKVSLFFGGRRGSEREMLVELRRGRLQAAGLSNGIVATEVPEVGVLELPFLFRSAAEADHVIDDVIGRDLEAKIAEKGLYLGFWAENGWRSIGTRNRPIHRPEDVVGLKVRAQESPINVAFWNELHAVPIEIPLTEVLPSLQTGVIEAFDQTPVYMSGAGWHTQIKYYTLTEHSYQPAGLYFNKRFIDALPEDLRKIVLGDPRRETLENRRRVRAMADEVLRALPTAKIEVIRLTDAEKEAFRAKVAGVSAEVPGVTAALIAKVQKALEEMRASQR